MGGANTATGIGMGYLKRHWRGELPLGVSFWLNGVAFLLAGAVLAETLSPYANQLPGSYNAALFAGTVLLASTSLILWQVVGIWRAAARRPAFVRYLTRGVLGLVLFGQAASLALVQIPSLREGMELGQVLDRIGHWQITLRNGGHDVEIAGGVGAGIAEDFARDLARAPEVRLVHLNLRHGGLVSEALRLAELIRARGLDTYTTDKCVSACTIIYLAGENRFLRRDARLGFHAYVAPGGSASQSVQGEILNAAGVAPDFVARAMKTPHNDVWYPTLQELVSAAVVTEIVDGGDFAASGFGKSKSDRELTAELTEIRLFDVLHEREPDSFEEVLRITREVVNAGKPVNAARNLMAPVLERLRDKYLRYADDQSVNRLYRDMIGQAKTIAAADGALCYRHLMNPTANAEDHARIKSILGARAGSYEFDAIANLIATADPKRAQPGGAELKPLKERVIRQVALRHGPQQFASTFNGSITDPGQGCTIVLDFFQTILAMPPEESAKILRSFARAG
jgi:hypothetical protein